MIKAAGRDGLGQPLIVLGLTDENIERLRTGGDEGLGRPIRFNMAELGFPPVTVAIIAGPSESALAARLREFGLSGPDL